MLSGKNSHLQKFTLIFADLLLTNSFDSYKSENTEDMDFLPKNFTFVELDYHYFEDTIRTGNLSLDFYLFPEILFALKLDY